MRTTLLVLTATVTLASQGASPKTDRTVDFGNVVVTLGQAEADVLPALRRQYEIKSAAENAWSLWSKGPTGYRNVGNVWFRNGRLSGASRSWEPDDQQQSVPFATAVYGAIRELTGDQVRLCEVSVSSRQIPGSDFKDAFIVCGTKRIEIRAHRTDLGNFGTIGEIIETASSTAPGP